MSLELIPSETANRDRWGGRLLSRPLTVFYLATFVISWTGALCLVAHFVFRGEHVPKFSGLMMFPVMLLGPSFTGLFMCRATRGASGARALLHRITFWRFSWHWYTALLIPAGLIVAALSLLAMFASPIYKPNLFLAGGVFGLIAGFVEEIGWTGFAFPEFLRTHSAFRSAVLMGMAWSVWHIPVIDYLGTATPHGAWWLEYFLAFSFAMTAIRVLICWLYANTGSLLLAQLMHAASTGALVVLSPTRVSAAQESLWYALYGCLLWLVVAIVRFKCSASLTGSEMKRD